MKSCTENPERKQAVSSSTCTPCMGLGSSPDQIRLTLQGLKAQLPAAGKDASLGACCSWAWVFQAEIHLPRGPHRLCAQGQGCGQQKVSEGRWVVLGLCLRLFSQGLACRPHRVLLTSANSPYIRLLHCSWEPASTSHTPPPPSLLHLAHLYCQATQESVLHKGKVHRCKP